jgi:hypothetical protein
MPVRLRPSPDNLYLEDGRCLECRLLSGLGLTLSSGPHRFMMSWTSKMVYVCRADRVIELSRAFDEEDFDCFDRKRIPKVRTPCHPAYLDIHGGDITPPGPAKYYMWILGGAQHSTPKQVILIALDDELSVSDLCSGYRQCVIESMSGSLAAEPQTLFIASNNCMVLKFSEIPSCQCLASRINQADVI